MRANRIAIVDLKTMEACDLAIDSIENDYVNCSGGIRSWNDGRQTTPTTAAVNKIAAIRRKSDRLWDKWLHQQHKIYVKENGPISFEEYQDSDLCC